MNYKERIAELLQTPRVYWTALENEDHGVEVGCFSGVSSRVISLHCGLLHCVDPWSWGAVAQAEQMFDAMLPDYPNIVKVKLPSVQAAGQYDDHSLDFVYVDADHAYASVVEDITAWKNKVKQGGFIAGHDSYRCAGVQPRADRL